MVGTTLAAPKTFLALLLWIIGGSSRCHKSWDRGRSFSFQAALCLRVGVVALLSCLMSKSPVKRTLQANVSANGSKLKRRSSGIVWLSTKWAEGVIEPGRRNQNYSAVILLYSGVCTFAPLPRTRRMYRTPMLITWTSRTYKMTCRMSWFELV